MSEPVIYECTPRQVRKFVIRCMFSGVVPMIESSPAMGKSALVKSIAKEFNLELIDHRLSTSTPEDLSGLPKFITSVNGIEKATFAPFDLFPVEGDPLPTGKQGWLIFLDEFSSTAKAVQAAAYKLVLDKMTGQKRLHENVVIVCAGNLMTDRAIVNPIGTALQSRLIWLKMRLDFKEFMEDVALPQKWDNRVVAYLNYKPSALHDFKPEHNEKTFCAPRTWEFIHKLISGQEYRTVKKTNEDGSTYDFYTMEEEAPLYAGAITSGEAVSFINFTKVFESLPKISDIIYDPMGTDLPKDRATTFGTIMHLVEHADDDNFDPVSEYVGRMSSDFRVLFYRALIIQKPDLKKHASFRKAMVQISRYLHDDDDTQAAA